MAAPVLKAATIGFNAEYAQQAPEPQEIAALGGIAVLEFGAPWCGYCMAAQQAVQALLLQHPDWCHIKVYDGKGKTLGRAFRVTLWPTVILLRDGREVSRVVRPLRADDFSDWGG
jgi:thioredoxin 1